MNHQEQMMLASRQIEHLKLRIVGINRALKTTDNKSVRETLQKELREVNKDLISETRRAGIHQRAIEAQIKE
jgi:hypothetical protein